MSKLITVNVIELDAEGNVLSVQSWAGSPDGNADAEKAFIAAIKYHTSDTAFADEEFQAMIDDGMCDDCSLGGHKIFIAHSS